MSDESGEIGRMFFAAQDKLRGGPAPELCTDDYRAHLGGNPAMDLAGHQGFARAFYAAFAELRHEVVDVFAAADKVAVRFTIHGRHTAAFFGIPTTDREIHVHANVLLHVRDGRVRELFGVFDEAGMLRQLGVLPD